jgi:hypothetical protein
MKAVFKFILWTIPDESLNVLFRENLENKTELFSVKGSPERFSPSEIIQTVP